jgi:hypothetical protein
MTMIYSRPGGMSQDERAKTLRRMGGGTIPNASGATQAAPQPLQGGHPPALSPDQAAVADSNRKLREAQAQALKQLQTQADKALLK